MTGFNPAQPLGLGFFRVLGSRSGCWAAVAATQPYDRAIELPWLTLSLFGVLQLIAAFTIFRYGEKMGFGK